MATFKFYIPAINLMGAGCLQEAAADIKGYGYRKCSPPPKMKKMFTENEKLPAGKFIKLDGTESLSLISQLNRH
ncbi:hypothetical protein [Aeromonas sp. FDAARGOS 1407]|uniref:hypothetical protein n=1 Tax=Aeromonas TaxID=642 RepID=UPI001C230B48|nr:hypothetical protein [Aeromonas sp. FDAARGOS 1407]QXC33681.1 hypothetical protein I6L37_19335 [Aeromonas sp. FDAARGOS 1407]